jgi:hypothetical protein
MWLSSKHQADYGQKPMSLNNMNVRDFADDWVVAWNAGNIEAVLEHFHDNAVFTSPLAENVVIGSGGVIHGKDALRNYWQAALDRNPALKFDLISTYSGIDCVVICFRNEKGERKEEILRFRDELIFEGHGTYA